MTPTYNESIVDAILIVLKLAEEPLTPLQLADRVKVMITSSTNPQIKAHLRPLIDGDFVRLTTDLRLRCNV